MGLATICVDVAPIFEQSNAVGARIDEGLYGSSIQVIDQQPDGWCYIRTDYHVQGYVRVEYLDTNTAVAASWAKYPKMLVLAPYIDIQQKPAREAAVLRTVPRGSQLVALGSPDLNGWQKVGMHNGSIGYTRASYLGEAITDWRALSEDDMRWNIVESALAYNGTAYRLGGRSPMGIDAAGLVAMAYMLNGVSVPREEFFKEGGGLRRVEVAAMDEGDVIYFASSTGIYIGNRKFVHATEDLGSEGVIVNSLDEKDSDYRGDLARHIVAVASLY